MLPKYIKVRRKLDTTSHQSGTGELIIAVVACFLLALLAICVCALRRLRAPRYFRRLPQADNDYRNAEMMPIN